MRNDSEVLAKGKNSEEPLTLDSEAAAQLIGVGRTTLWKLYAIGNLPHPIRLSERVVRWRRVELEAWVSAGCPNRDKWAWPI